MQGNTLLGQVDPLSLYNRKEGPVVLALGGRSWRVASIDWARDRVYVEPSEERGASRWMGGTRGVSRVIATQVRELIEHPPAADALVLTKRSSVRVAEVCGEQESTLVTSPIRLDGDSYEWWTYEGLASNLVLAAKIAAAGVLYSAVGSYCLRFTLSEACLAGGGGWPGIRRLDPMWSSQEEQRIKFADLVPTELINQMTYERTVAMSRLRQD